MKIATISISGKLLNVNLRLKANVNVDIKNFTNLTTLIKIIQILCRFTLM